MDHYELLYNSKSGGFSTDYFIDPDLLVERIKKLRRDATIRTNGIESGKVFFDFDRNCWGYWFDPGQDYRNLNRYYGYKVRVFGGWKFFETAEDMRTWKAQR